MANLTGNATLDIKHTMLGPTEEKLYLGIGLGTGLLVMLVIVIIIVASIVTRRKDNKSRPRTGRFVSVANSDFDTYNAINPVVFNNPASNPTWLHRNLPSSPTPTITTIANDYFIDGYTARDYGPMSMKVMDQMFSYKA
ncbi:uncharacterized protein LOC106073615 isoform X2 [Biomphalaria glabrata]|uniref:Uncharacterized protein LOC106073615 isoform X2 n=1 Tax=Biomphalaria glabrata TaxID=6526 RepID=A0A9W2ZFE8_BIOGL|nr:uncharacterized protein LOC106073615 isoform X2 [Biomphalaria glabrata]